MQKLLALKAEVHGRFGVGHLDDEDAVLEGFGLGELGDLGADDLRPEQDRLGAAHAAPQPPLFKDLGQEVGDAPSVFHPDLRLRGPLEADVAAGDKELRRGVRRRLGAAHERLRGARGELQQKLAPAGVELGGKVVD